MNEIRLNELQPLGILKTYLNFAFVREAELVHFNKFPPTFIV